MIIALAETKNAEEEKQERRQRAYHGARAHYEAQVHARNDENAICALLRDTNRLQRADRLREFIPAVEDRGIQNSDLTPGKQQRIELANAKADWLDPLVRRADPILDTPEPDAPDFWKF